jgi:acetylglutamate kinase
MPITQPKTKPEVLIEALDWIQKFSGSIVVVKFGGNAMVDEALGRTFANDIIFMHTVGLKPVVVHGGGPQISQMLEKLGITSEFRDGFRVTTPEAMDVVQMVLTGKISREIAHNINTSTTRNRGLAVGISGIDGGLFSAVRKTGKTSTGEDVDLGLVGDVVDVDPSAIIELVEAGRIPVVSTIAPNITNKSEVLNINADIAAGALAKALCAKKLVILTDVAGLYANYPDPASLISKIGTDDLENMLDSLQTGMIPKMTSCLQAVRGGVEGAHIIDGRIPHSILEEIFTKDGVGTYVVKGSALEMNGKSEHTNV